MQATKMASSRGNVYLVKIGEKPVEDGSQDICKDKESNVGPVAGYYQGRNEVFGIRDQRPKKGRDQGS